MEKELDFTKTQTPNGTKDYLPLEAKKKRYLENEINDIFTRWGYEEVVTPTFEFFSALSVGTGVGLQHKMYKFFDRNGHILALRPEMTAPIARLVANRLDDELKPLRLSYQANVFRYEPPQAGRQREFYQAGIELIGAKDPLADAEIIAVAVEILKAVGLKKFSIDIGQIDYFVGLMEEMNLDPQTKVKLRKALSQKDFVALKELVEENLSNGHKEAIFTLPELRGGREILDKAEKLVNNKKSKVALDNLRSIYQNLESLGVADCVNLDLNIIRGFDYYTGMVFEGYNQDLGFTICGGGRYDNLLEQFGTESPATGFAVGIDRLLLSLENQGVELAIEEEPLFLIYDKAKKGEAIELAKKLRVDNQEVVLEIIDRNINESINYALNNNLDQIIYLGEEKNVADREYQIENLLGIEIIKIIE
ncbi:ATP phosphoribosyltransferase regulatory subunit [Selenihalanaerobacter shriftii]|uniref:Histidine--tRNA ligase n=1 Tax=Selenihalanaerobacter shriftii TaxID=142842 RepID=A0A1T4JLS6_9FIRM|nr:ATP phosphoribosyltransferase regulatory subunit [Selenihalanaerobacter shriftii]SJZ31078.1 ATP phosphoribosyltransferase regulatory subunit [Selenihalanaerobacter shriftii]